MSCTGRMESGCLFVFTIRQLSGEGNVFSAMCLSIVRSGNQVVFSYRLLSTLAL